MIGFKHSFGFTLIELILVMSIFLTLVALASPALLGGRAQVDINTAMATVIGDLRSQQLKAMVGDTGGRESSDTYGIHFETASYTLFHGASYVEGEPTNAVITLGGSSQFGDVAFPGRQVVFSQGSGEVLGFVPGADSFTLADSNGNESRQVVLNQYGVVTQSD